MKMRVQNNAIRFRLTRNEVADFALTGRASASIQFGGDSSLTYTLQRAGALDGMQAVFTGREIHIRIPDEMSREWTDGDEAGMHGKQRLENGEQLEIVIEKDFQCLHKGDAARDPDAYPNPLALTS